MLKKELRMMRELTDEQRKLIDDYIVEQNGYKRIKALICQTLKYIPVEADMEDWVGVAHTALVKAACTYKEGSCNFATYAHLNIASKIKDTLSQYSRKKRGGDVITVSLDAPVCENLTIEDVVTDGINEISFDNIIDEFLSYFNNREQTVLRYLIDGYSRDEVYKFTGCNRNYIDALLKHKCQTPEIISIKNRIVEKKRGYRSYDEA